MVACDLDIFPGLELPHNDVRQAGVASLNAVGAVRGEVDVAGYPIEGQARDLLDESPGWRSRPLVRLGRVELRFCYKKRGRKCWRPRMREIIQMVREEMIGKVSDV